MGNQSLRNISRVLTLGLLETNYKNSWINQKTLNAQEIACLQNVTSKCLINKSGESCSNITLWCICFSWKSLASITKRRKLLTLYLCLCCRFVLINFWTFLSGCYHDLLWQDVWICLVTLIALFWQRSGMEMQSQSLSLKKKIFAAISNSLAPSQNIWLGL